VNLNLFLVGLGKVFFGLLVAAVGIFIATRLLGRMLKFGKIDDELARGNLAAAALVASAVVSLGLLAQHAVIATFSAMDLAFHGQAMNPTVIVTFVIYGLAHVVVAFIIGCLVLVLGAGIFNRLTKGVDELAEVRKGNLAPALVLGAVLIVLAIMTAPGLEMALNGLLPLPTLARDEMITPT
jgi:uncharacterized membrane protein YjfL (UPF0719 family)